MIDMLNNDCLMHIFSYLNTRDRVRIERVSKRWKSLLKDMWLYQQHLDFSHNCSAKSLRGLLHRCGPYVVSLDLSHMKHEYFEFNIIGDNVPNLRWLNLSDIQWHPADDTEGFQERILEMLFLSSRSLESVNLSRNKHLKGFCLNGLPEDKLTELILDDCTNLLAEFLIRGLKRLPRLEKLGISACMNLTNRDLADILRIVPQLKSLSAARYNYRLACASLSAVGLLTNLTSLNLKQNDGVNDENMDVIARSCLKLQQLNVTGCCGCSFQYTDCDIMLTDFSFFAVAELPDLVHVSVSFMTTVGDQALAAFADKGRLKTLNCSSSKTITDAGCSRIVTGCSELELFDFSCCSPVTNITVNAAVKAVRERTNNVKLTLVAGCTGITRDAVTEEVPLLKLDIVNRAWENSNLDEYSDEDEVNEREFNDDLVAYRTRRRILPL